jgi:hypothetical protein
MYLISRVQWTENIDEVPFGKIVTTFIVTLDSFNNMLIIRLDVIFA